MSNENEAGTLPAVKSHAETMRNLLDKSKPQIAAALPSHLNVDRLIRIAMTSMQRTPKLLECSTKSLLGAIIQSAQIGLEPDDILGRAYLIPYKREAKLMIGYKGFIELAKRSGQVSHIFAQVIYECEQFDLSYGGKPFLIHRPLPPAERGTKIIAAYAVAMSKSLESESSFEFLWAEEIEAIRSSAKTQDIWNQYPVEMYKKTAIRRLAKYLSLSPELSKAASIDELGEIGKSQKEVFFDETDIIEVQSNEATEKAHGKQEELAQKLKKITGPNGHQYRPCNDCKKLFDDPAKLSTYKDGTTICYECAGKRADNAIAESKKK